MSKVLFTTICRPIGPAHGDAKSVGYELLFGQVTRAQGLFSPRATHLQFGLEYIANNIDAPTTVLQYPSRRQLIRELKKGYDYVGMAFILATFHRMKEVVALVRKYAPKTKIVLGGYGTVLSDEELKPYADYICREEGVAFMRRVLGEPERAMPYDHPLVVSKLKVFSLPASKTGMVFAGLGCANGCDFCCTSHFFKRRHIRLLRTGKDIYDVMCRYADEKGVDQFTILDEDFLLNKPRAMQLRRHVLKGKRTFGIFAFASVRALSRYTPKELVEMGIDGLWVGYEGARSGYEKQAGSSPAELFPRFTRHGILVLASMIVGFDYQDREVIREELRGLLRLRPALTQFLIYGPTPGTPFYDRVMKEERLRPLMAGDRHKYYHDCTGFKSMVTHPKLSASEIEEAQAECFETDYQTLGPSMLRSVRIWLSGYENMKNSPSIAMRRKAARFGKEVRRSYPLFLAGRLLAPNKRIRRWVTAFERRAHRVLGVPKPWEEAAAVAALGAALWTRFTLSVDWFQHPRIGASRYRWDYLPEPLMKLWGEIRDSGVAAELRVQWQRQTADGLCWVRLEGVLDGKNAGALGRKFKETVSHGRERFIFNLEKLQSIDRAAMAEFYRAFRKYRDNVRVIPPLGQLPAAPELRKLVRYFSPLPEFSPTA